MWWIYPDAEGNTYIWSSEVFSTFSWFSSQTFCSLSYSDVLHSYQRGMTPNPDVLCNKHIKFKAFLEYAMGRSADIIATGHYAQLRCREEGDVSLVHPS